MADWDAPERTYRTMGRCSSVNEGLCSHDIDHEYEIRQLRVFQALVRRGECAHIL